MRILHLSNSDSRGGAAIAAYRLHGSLNKINDIESIFYCQRKYNRGSDARIIPSTNLLQARVKNRMVSSLGSVVSREYARWPSSLCMFNGRVPELVSSIRPDVIHLHWVQGEMLSIKDIGLIDVPIVWTFHDCWPFCGVEHHPNEEESYVRGYSHKPYFSLRNGVNLNRIVWNQKSAFYPKYGVGISPSRWMYEKAIQSPLLKGWDHHVIPHFVDALKGETKEESREKLSLQNDAFVVYTPCGTNGSADPFKGYQFLREIMEKINGLDKDILFIGIGADLPRVGLKTRVFPRSYEPNYISRILNASDVCLIPSVFESFCLTALEAHAQGVPVVCFDAGGIRDIVDQGNTGQICNVGDCTAIAKACEEIVIDSRKSNLYASNAINRARLCFSEEICTSRHLEIYKKLLVRNG